MNIYERPADSQLTRFEILTLGCGSLAGKMGSALARSLWESGDGSSVSAKLGSFFGRGGPSDELTTRCMLAILGVTVLEVIRISPRFDPEDPHGFQERFFGAVLEQLVPEEFRPLFFQATQENIGDVQQLLAGDIENSQYLFRVSARFFERGDFVGPMGVGSSFPAIVEYVHDMAEVLEED